MSILGVDYGKKKIGLAIATSTLAEPHKVIKVKSLKDAVKKVEKVIKVERAEMVVVGISEGKMAKETKEFAEKLKELVKIPIVFQDETLSTQESQRLSIEANISRKKRHELEDAYAAALILQNYLDAKL
jgi:putative Holliday junction resolvase